MTPWPLPLNRHLLPRNDIHECCDTHTLAYTQFKQIASAYEVLGDEEKRKLYDKGGEESLKESGGGMHDAYDVFDMFFGGGGRRGKKDNRTKDMIYPLKVYYTCTFYGDVMDSCTVCFPLYTYVSTYM